MSVAADCPACAWGNHEHHDASHGLKPGLIGGSHCACPGDCAERFKAECEHLADLWFPFPVAPTDSGRGGTAT